MGKKHKKHEIQEEKSSEDEVSIDLTKVKAFFSSIKKSKIINPTTLSWALIILIIIVSTTIRLYPLSLPVTDDWATNTVMNNVQSNIASQIKAGNPSLPDASVNAQAQQQLGQVYAQNKDQIDSQIQTLSQQFKSALQDEKGQTYLLAIDPYLWYSYAKWHEQTGFYGNTIIDGQEKFTLRNGRIGMKADFLMPPAVIVTLHNLITIFNPGQDILYSSFILPAILIALAIIPAFFLGKKLGGIPGGFFAATIFALSGPILGRTTAGFSDTDAYTFVFPFLIIWLFLEAIEAKSTPKKIIVSALTGLATVLFSFFWFGWWYTFLLVVGMAGIYTIYNLIKKYIKQKKISGKEFFSTIKPELIFFGVFFISLFIFTALLAALVGYNVGTSLTGIVTAPLEPFNFILGFKSAAEGVTVGQGLNYPLWPNVLTTVAELNPGSTADVINGGGGTLLIWAAVLGIILLLFKKVNGEIYPLYGILLAVWFASTYYAGHVGIRFISLFAPVVAFGIAGLIGSLTGQRMKDLAKKAKISAVLITATVVIIGIIFIVYPQFTAAKIISKNQVPSYDDTWNNALITIKNSSENAIISSWWDFGHWFEAMSERSVTFDGGDQGRRIHWIGLTLLSSDEDESLDILKMLNCGQEEGYNTLLNHTKDKLRATKIIKEIIRQSRGEAKKTLQASGLAEPQAEQVLDYTHCTDLTDIYFITSEDMVGKAGVWGHFGSWDFDKSYMYYKLKKLPLPEAIEIAKKDLGYDEATTKKLYNEAILLPSENEANLWISPYPNYLTGAPVACSEDKTQNIIKCNYNIFVGTQNNLNLVIAGSIVNLTDYSKSTLILQARDQRTNSVISQNSLTPPAVIVDKDGKLDRIKIADSNMQYDIILFKDEAGTYYTLLAHPLLSESLFTKLFFMDGKYAEHFEKVFDERSFRGQRIIVWKVNP